MRYSSLCLAVALLSCDFQRRKWQKSVNDVLLSSSIFVNGATNQSVVYCPHYGSSCLNSYDENLLYSSMSNGTDPNCCEQCDSEPSAMRCCSEIMSCKVDVSNDQGKNRVCIRTVSDLYDIGVLAVATCPEQSDDDHHVKCVQRYTAGWLYTVEAYDVMPVRDVISDTLYRNIHCALCNGRNTSNIKFWELSVGCHYTSNLKLATDSNILNTIKNVSDCYFKYKNPEPDAIVETCSTAIATCNETGYWMTYDQAIFEGCFSGERLELEAFGVLYKNKDCLKCNGAPLSGETKKDLENPSFSMSLRIGNTEQNTISHPSSCKGGMVYHRPKGQCVEARCSLLRQLRGNVCERTVPNPDSFAYRIGFRIIPQDRSQDRSQAGSQDRSQDRSQNRSQRAAISVETGYEIIPEIGKQIKNLILSVFPSTEWIVYEMLLIGDLEYSDTFNFSELLQADLAYYELQLKLVYPESHDPEHKLIDLIALDNDATLNIGQPNIGFKVRIYDCVLHFRKMRGPRRGCVVTFDDFDLCQSDPLSESTIKTNPLEHLTAITIFGSNFHARSATFFKSPVSTERSILELRTCSFVKVTKSEIAWTETEFGIEFGISQTDPLNATGWVYRESSESRKIPLNAYEYMYGESSDVIWMCLETHEKLFFSRSASFADTRRVDLVLITLMIASVAYLDTSISLIRSTLEGY